ncbi:uncharacterized protein YjdB [Planomicrobium stackebrandtii]|uniref:Uncharacterized protein YjdB n=1 Tax=Planomicrobium stackebrandtii TaxID=253160 RepID=A0ABU0GTX7_9BACL|nr:hypothetical protein [Planomicrobium stackebrandtii]MDQ0428528.1 uncharacterized protein YjdB [Planomicrobium stackebrandtii]
MTLSKELQSINIESNKELEQIQHNFVEVLGRIGVTDIKDIAVNSSLEDNEKSYGWILRG